MTRAADPADEAVDLLLRMGGHLGQFVAALSPEGQVELRRLARVRVLHARATLVTEGDHLAEIGFVLSGTLGMTKLLPDGRMHIIGLLVPRDLYGRVFDGPYHYDITAISEARILAIGRAGFERLLGREPEAERILLVQVLEELEAAREWILLLSGPKVIHRVASFLVILVRRLLSQRGHDGGAPTVDLPLSRADLANYLGTRPETLSRTFHQLADMGAIRLLDPSRFEIVDLGALIEASGQDLVLPGAARAPR